MIAIFSKSQIRNVVVSFFLIGATTPLAFADSSVGNLFGPTKGEIEPIIPASVVQEIVDNEQEKEKEKEEENKEENNSNGNSSSLQDMTAMFMMGYQMLQQLQGAEKQGIMGGQNDDGGCSGGGCSNGDGGGCSGGSCSAGGGGGTAAGGGTTGGQMNGGIFGSTAPPSILPNLDSFSGARLPFPNVVGGCADGKCPTF